MLGPSHLALRGSREASLLEIINQQQRSFSALNNLGCPRTIPLLSLKRTSLLTHLLGKSPQMTLHHLSAKSSVSSEQPVSLNLLPGLASIAGKHLHIRGQPSSTGIHKVGGSKSEQINIRALKCQRNKIYQGFKLDDGSVSGFWETFDPFEGTGPCSACLGGLLPRPGV